MALLFDHLAQIALSGRTIAELEFPPPKIFTNALLGSHEITTLIRDTEPHERALFSVESGTISEITSKNNRRHTSFTNGHNDTYFGHKSVYTGSLPVKQSAVARVLGNDLLQEIRHSNTDAVRSRRGVNIEILLRGAEKLTTFYSVEGASEKITALRDRHRQIIASLSVYEDRVANQQTQLNKFNRGQHSDVGQDLDNETVHLSQGEVKTLTERDFQAEEDEVQELEVRKKTLENRIAGLEKDLGGLLK